MFYTKFFSVVIVCLVLAACGKSGSEGGNRDFAGKYVDEFGNKFELREDHTATVQFAGQDNVNETHWFDGENHDSPFATIEYNGDPAYYYMRDGVLYRYKQDMDNGHPAIKLEKEE